MSLPDNHDTSTSLPLIEFLTALFFGSTGTIFLQTLANDPADPDEAPNKRHLMSRDVDVIERFVAKHNRNRRGVFVCVGTLVAGSHTRSKDNVQEIVCAHIDLDYKGILQPQAEVLEIVKRLAVPPSIVVMSGGGLHLYWLYREPLDAPAHRERHEIMLRRLADILAGDLATCEISRLMRLPGTINSKYGDQREVLLTRCHGDVRYELETLEDWADEQRPLLTRKVSVAQLTKNELPLSPPVPDGAASNPFLAFAASMGHKPRLDVEQALAQMGQGNIHDTQTRVSASLISAGRDVEEVVSILMEATRQAAGDVRWDWRAEERAIRTACAGALRKYPPKPAEEPIAANPPADLSAARARKQAAAEPPRKPGKTNHLDIGKIFLAGLAASGQQLMFTKRQGAWLYQDGLWSLQDDRELRLWLDAKIELCIRGTEAKSILRLVNETRAWIIRHPDLQAPFPGDVPFDSHGCVPVRGGLVEPATGLFVSILPDHYCTWRIECFYDPQAVCPWWITMLQDCFADRPPDVLDEYLCLLQEMLGAGLIDAKPRSLSKALILQGGSNAGKSGLIEVMAGLFGEAQNTTSLDALDGPHGLVPFASRLPWVLHEAFDQRKWHFSATVKALITGEPVQINVKNGPILSRRFTAPVIWGTNSPPQFQEASKAIVSRIIVLRCWQEFDETRPIGAAAEALRLGLHRPSALVLDREMPGLLTWALAGLQRALARGYFRTSQEAIETAHEIRLDSNLVAGFVEDCCTFDMENMITAPDFCAAFAAWWSEHKGENRSIPSNESIGRALAALGDARIGINRHEIRTDKRRCYAGLKLTDSGLRYFEIALASDLFKGKTTTTSSPGQPVNHPIPGSWDTRPSVQAMRLAHIKKHDRSHDRSPDHSPGLTVLTDIADTF